MLAIAWGIMVGIALTKLAQVLAEQWTIYKAWKRAQPFWIKGFEAIPRHSVPSRGNTLILSKGQLTKG